MIPPLTDRPPPGDDTAGFTGGTVSAPASSVPFAELLGGPCASATVHAIADANLPVSADAGARLFNQDGFFGAASAMPPPAGLAPRDASPPAEQPRSTAINAVAAEIGALHDLTPCGPPTGLDPLPRDRSSMKLQLRDGPHVVPVSASATFVSPTSLRSITSTPDDVEMPVFRTAPRRSFMLPSATVAIAIHAVARGLDVLAQVSGLDAIERKRLANEIASLLATHGYSPARVTVATPPASSAGRQEYR